MYRNSGTLNITSLSHDFISTPIKATDKEQNKDQTPFFTQLDELGKEGKPDQRQNIPADLHELLMSKDAFAAAFLSAGWLEAALQLNTLKVIPPSFPNWFSYELAQAIRANRSNEEALDFVKMQKPTPELSLLTAELNIAKGNQAAAMETLKKLYKENTDVGFRSAWLLSLIYIEKKQYAEAKNAINAQPRLDKDILGQETLARIALLEGNVDLANKLYKSIEGKSSEAKSYLARKAFAEKDWKKAKELTQELLIQYPENPLLIDNMKKILEEENKQPLPH